MYTTERIDLHLPTSWNAMTIKELETIASVLIKEATRTTDTRPFNTLSTKVEMFFALAELELIEGLNPEVSVEEQYYVVRRGKSETFHLYLWQIHYWIQENMKWIDKPSSLTRFPYPMLRRRFRMFKGPSALMQNFNWRQYRIAGDCMTNYINQENQLVLMQKSDKFNAKDIKKQRKHVDLAKAMFLATIFCRSVKHINEETKRKEKDFTYVSNQSSDNAKYFRNFPDEKFQVILFWWTGMMNYLKSKYPKCFKSESPKKQVQTNPLELYTRTTATLEKYLNQNEDEQNRKLYTIVLQHLNDMVVQSDQIEAMNRKK